MNLKAKYIAATDFLSNIILKDVQKGMPLTEAIAREHGNIKKISDATGFSIAETTKKIQNTCEFVIEVLDIKDRRKSK